MSGDRKRRLEERFVELMDRVSTQRRARPLTRWSDVELTMPQVRTLILLSQGSRRMGDLAEYLGRSMSATTNMVDRLLRKGLVERVEGVSDRRVVACQLTPKGAETVEQFLRMGRMRSEALAAVLTVQELEVVVPAMVILAEALGRQAPPDFAGDDPDSDDRESEGTPVAAES